MTDTLRLVQWRVMDTDAQIRHHTALVERTDDAGFQWNDWAVMSHESLVALQRFSHFRPVAG